MKRTLTLILAFALCLALCACCMTHDYKKGVCVECGAVDPNYDAEAAAYDDLMKMISDYDKYKNIYAGDDIRYLYGGKAVQFLYQKLTEMKDYRDCAEYLSRFTEVKDKLLYLQLEEKNNSGKLINSTTIDYEYDALGRVTATEHDEYMQMLGFGVLDYEIGEGQYSIGISYGKDGRMESLTYNYVTLIGLVSPEYDENGRIISMFHQHYDAEYNCEFTYDEEGRLISVIYDDDYELTFEYNPDGTMHSKRVGSYKTVFSYDEAGNRTGWTRGSTVCTTELDEEGNILRERIVTDNSVTILEYVYGSYYVYNK